MVVPWTVKSGSVSLSPRLAFLAVGPLYAQASFCFHDAQATCVEILRSQEKQCHLLFSPYSGLWRSNPCHSRCVHIHSVLCVCMCYIVPSTHHGHLQPSVPPLCGYRGCQAGSTPHPPTHRLLAQHGRGAATDTHGAGCVLSGSPILFPLQGDNVPQCSVLVQPWVTLSSEHH